MNISFLRHSDHFMSHSTSNKQEKLRNVLSGINISLFNFTHLVFITTFPPSLLHRVKPPLMVSLSENGV